jgi:hypothetical protein
MRIACLDSKYEGFFYFKQGFSFLPRGIHSSSSNRGQITSYQNHPHLPIINNDVTVENFNVPIQNLSDMSRDISGVSNLNHSSSREPLPSSTTSNPSLENPISASPDDFFPRQLIAVSDNASSNYTQCLDNDGISQGTSEQTMELLRPMSFSSQRY